MADENAVLMYKGRPLMRKDNLVYYGSMADSHIVMLQVLETKKLGDLDVATKVSVQLQLTDPAAKPRAITKLPQPRASSISDSLWTRCP